MTSLTRRVYPGRLGQSLEVLPGSDDVLKLNRSSEPAVEAWAGGQQAVQSNNEGAVEFRILPPDGGLRWMSSRGRVQFGDTGKSEYFMGVSLDIT